MGNIAPTPKPQGPRWKGRTKGVNLRHLATATMDVSLTELFDCLHDPPVDLIQTAKGDDISEGRYENAEEFFPRLGPWPKLGMNDIYYKAGITAQMALSAHLLKVGFPDRWCAERIGYRVAHALAYANATGLNHRCPDMARLAAALTPYWQWNCQSVHHYGQPRDPGFTVEEVRELLRALLAQVRAVTGYRLMNDDLA